MRITDGSVHTRPRTIVSAYRHRADQSRPQNTNEAERPAIRTMYEKGLNSNRMPMTSPLTTSQPIERVWKPRTIANNAVKNTGSDGVHVAKCSTCIVGDRKFVGQRT